MRHRQLASFFNSWQQKAGLPLYRLLGSSETSTGFYSEEKGTAALAEEARAAVKAGFRAVKMKVGGLPLPADPKRVETVRETIGDDPFRTEGGLNLTRIRIH
ncbi:enolase C-terminal domain-like protein [Paenactinomyces guangxiensis]|uniref:Enolase C-terminal domain-containing protein n=1 Tax=Paenactinomyces guangxiensis TaxID=1490290 RepID=A0A7W1WSS7_9BACL|nr:enolase C-terminal domain-like protein [Paenactinomyces guangxiensis]MBA4495384.1 hypothetical protein [Paenactinomyces guangxiensis]MBH8592495.1 hypothetical protein [Paenactinomyces guangxiensis]